MADLAETGRDDLAPNRLTFVLLAGVLAASGLIYHDLAWRDRIMTPAEFGLNTPLTRSVAESEKHQDSPEPVQNAMTELAVPAEIPPADAALIDMSPELKGAFDTVLRGKSLLEGEKPQDLDGEKLLEKASSDIGYALRVTPSDTVEEEVPGGAAGTPLAIAGNAIALSGDTLRLNDLSLRLQGIRSPGDEDQCRNAGGSAYDCAAWAKESLTAALGAREISCEIAGTPSALAAVPATCHLHIPGRPAMDLSGWMVSSGAALVMEDGVERYGELQEEARANQRGLWSGSLGQPDEAPAGQER